MSRFYRMLPGVGMLALDEFVTNFEKIGYTGVYSLEVFNDHYRQIGPVVMARRGFESLKALISGA